MQYSQDLWKALEQANLIGANATLGKHYQGVHPHGAILDTIEAGVTVNGHQGHVIVKRNYGGEDASIEKVANDPGKYLGAITVMFKREAGYDPENGDWFWAKYLPSGDLDKNPKGVQLAGRVAKGMTQGCIACHTGAPGKDMVFLHNRFAK
ncbi:MAG: cytochrome P460 family protein [Gammaproteobacteria bacterium]|nr:cytochrome P460 family protein [Gammaproteobacteria bacterium]